MKVVYVLLGNISLARTSPLLSGEVPRITSLDFSEVKREASIIRVI